MQGAMESPPKRTCYELIHTSMSSSPTEDPLNQARRTKVQMHASVQQYGSPSTYDEERKVLLSRFFIEELNKASYTPANIRARSGIRGQIGFTLVEATYGVAPEKIPDWWTFEQSCKRDVMALAEFEAWVHKRKSQACDLATKRLELIWKDHQIRQAAAEKMRQETADMLKRQRYESTVREQHMIMIREEQRKRAIVEKQKQEDRKLEQKGHQNTVRLQNYQTAIIVDQNRRKRKFEVFSEIQRCLSSTTAQQQTGSNVQNRRTVKSTQHPNIVFQREKVQFQNTTEQQKQRAGIVGQTPLIYRPLQAQHQIVSNVGLNQHAGRGPGPQQGLEPQKQRIVNVGSEHHKASGLQLQQKYSPTIDPSLYKAKNLHQQNQHVFMQKQNQPTAIYADQQRKKYARIRELQKKQALDATARASVRSTVPYQQHLEAPVIPNKEAVFFRSIQGSLDAFRGTALTK